MKNNLVCLLCVTILFFSCSTAYKTAQTPDDVYYSPAKKIIVQDKYETYASTAPEDNYLRMKAKNYDKWSDLDDYSYWHDSRYYANNWYSPYTSYMSLSFGYGLGYGYGFGSSPYYAYNPYMYNSWNSWYNPAYTVVYYKNPSTYYKPVRNNINSSGYINRNYNNTNNMPLQNDNRSRAYNNSSATSNSRGDYYNSSQNNTNNNNNTPSRTFNNSTNSSSSISSGGGARTSGGGSRVRP